jgi:pimeloyl-ACP methyl ester carboxylesterase
MDQWLPRQSYESREGTIRYDVFGEGPPLVLVHGTPFSSYVWHKIIPALSSRWTVFVYDLLGYGASEKRVGQDVSLAAQTNILADLLDHWALKAPHVAGHDFGGAIVLRAHLLKAQDFARIALLDPVALSPWGSGSHLHVRSHLDAYETMPERFHRAIVSAYIREATHRGLDEMALEPYLAPWLGPEGQAGFYRQMAQFDQLYTQEIEPLLGQVRRPVLILWGDEDRWLPLSQGPRLNQAIAFSEFRPVPNAGHLVQEDAPDIVSAALIEFFSRQNEVH